ncbi:MAG: hypothetical protein U5J96_19455 [Ignavibacteriaceae bacterium]|nr:hypothetical protein [Ignavibacteriaceae bacterium]
MKKLLKFIKLKLLKVTDLQPFQIEQSKKELIIGCGKNALRILELQQEGRKRMTAEEFLRGFRF